MKRVDVVVGLGYGDEGKGSIVDYLTRRHGAKLVVRFNGGAQAGHRVVLPDGRSHVFSQFGAGTLAGAATHLSRHVVVNPIAMMRESQVLNLTHDLDPFARTTVERDALVTTPFHVAMNRLREIVRGAGRHGSCGMGVGETVRDALATPLPSRSLRARDLSSPTALALKLRDIQDQKRREAWTLDTSDLRGEAEAAFKRELGVILDPMMVEEIEERFDAFARVALIVGPEWLRSELKKDQAVVFEGAQGVLLDQDHGFHPHTTWSDCTFNNAMGLLAGYDGEVSRIGVTRAFATRHGAGPLVSEDERLRPLVEDDHNATGEWQGSFRVGTLDLVALRYARDVLSGVDQVALTHVDKIDHYCEYVDGFVVDEYEVPPAKDDLFHEAPRRIRALRHEEVVDLARQERLTSLLRKVTPVTSSWHTSIVTHTLDCVATAMKAPVTIVSRGPSHADKTER